MALVDSALAESLLAIFNEMANAEMSTEQYAQKLAKCIDDQIKTAQVNVGINVQVDPVTGTGATIAPGVLS